MYMGTSDALFKGLIAVERELRQLHSWLFVRRWRSSRATRPEWSVVRAGASQDRSSPPLDKIITWVSLPRAAVIDPGRNTTKQRCFKRRYKIRSNLCQGGARGYYWHLSAYSRRLRVVDPASVLQPQAKLKKQICQCWWNIKLKYVHFISSL